MKKLGIIFILIFNFCFSQTNYTLKLKFEEKYFLSNCITSKTTNEFVLKVFKESDSVSTFDKSRNYIDILDATLRANINVIYNKEFTKAERIEYDSLNAEIKNGDLIKIFKSAVKANFGTEFLEEAFKNFGITNFKIVSTDYNRFSIDFSDKANFEKAQDLFGNNRLTFHNEIENIELEKIQNCFMKENDSLVKNNYLKKQKNYLLIYKDDANLFGDSYKHSKCFDSNKISFLLNDGEEYDVFSKLFFVKNTTELEKNLINSIVSFDFGPENNINSDGTFIFITILLNKNGQDFLKKYSHLNVGKNIFFGNKSEFLLNPMITEKLEDGNILLKFNLFEENWQKTFEFIRFAVFNNSLTVQ